MRSHLSGFIGLAIILIIGVMGFFIVKNYQSKASLELNELSESSRSHRFEQKMLETKLAKNSASMRKLSDFTLAWKVYLRKSHDANKVLNKIVQLSFKNTVAVSEKSVQRQRMDEGAEQIAIRLKVIGKFERIYSWLGEVGAAYPHAKLNELELFSENSNSAIRIALDIPVMNLG